jgi:hypothetical protein
VPQLAAATALNPKHAPADSRSGPCRRRLPACRRSGSREYRFP